MRTYWTPVDLDYLCIFQLVVTPRNVNDFLCLAMQTAALSETAFLPHPLKGEVLGGRLPRRGMICAGYFSL
ncbi:hypothetical protein AMD24_00788 [Candidatus Xiphinematobacter sp. Idaho Grape]|nr:hypothetical protein AMD24_00788 [Candidatus Xiphinematobacter sp. Idaho Grape]